MYRSHRYWNSNPKIHCGRLTSTWVSLQARPKLENLSSMQNSANMKLRPIPYTNSIIEFFNQTINSRAQAKVGLAWGDSAFFCKIRPARKFHPAWNWGQVLMLIWKIFVLQKTINSVNLDVLEETVRFCLQKKTSFKKTRPECKIHPAWNWSQLLMLFSEFKFALKL